MKKLSKKIRDMVQCLYCDEKSKGEINDTDRAS